MLLMTLGHVLKVYTQRNNALVLVLRLHIRSGLRLSSIGSFCMCRVCSLVTKAEGIPTERQVLVYAGVPLEDDVVVCNQVPEEGTVSVSVGVPGGALGWREGVCCVSGA